MSAPRLFVQVLVTGGSGVIGGGIIPHLLRRGHRVRLLSRHAEEDVKRFEDVEPFSGNVSEAETLVGAAAGCDAVIHIAGIVAEQRPETTFASVNVDGTRNMIEEARRSGANRFLYVSSLGAPKGSSEYHHSKFAAEQIVEQSGIDWTIVRPGAVYGPGDEVISTILKLVRALPAFPVVDDGEQAFQPIWYDDLGNAIVTLLERTDSVHRVYELAGSEMLTLNDLLRRFGDITDRHPLRVRVPMALASVGSKFASLVAHLPLDDVKLAMLRDGSTLSDPNAHPLAELGIEETSLDKGLRILADSIPEQLAEDGVGSMHHKKFYADISGSRHSATSLMTFFRDHVNDVMSIEFAAEPGAPERVEEGITLTGAIPLRGNFQIRVETVEPARVVFATIEGHPIAGIVEFTAKEMSAGVLRFSIDVFARAGNYFDLLALRAVGDAAQSANWRTVVRRMIEASGGTSGGVHQEKTRLSEEQAASIQKQVRSRVQERQRNESSAPEDSPKR